MTLKKTGLVAVIIALGLGAAACGKDTIAAETSYITTTETTTVTRETTTTVTETPDEEPVEVEEIVYNEAPAPVAPAAVEPVQPAPAPTATYYANCSAARAAGAAPVYAGQPGYGSHLDRDGDGIGCE